MRRLTAAADYSRLSLAAAAVLAVTRGERGRQAAYMGLASLAVTSAIVNVAISRWRVAGAQTVTRAAYR